MERLYKVYSGYSFECSNNGILVTHSECNRTETKTLKYLLTGRYKCPTCTRLMNIQNKLDKKFGAGKIEVLSEYKSLREPFRIRYTECGHETSITPESIMSPNLSKGCKECYLEKLREKKNSTESISKRVSEISNGEYYFNDEYRGTNFNIKYKFIHNTDAPHEFEMRLVDFLTNGHRCPFCAESHGESIIDNFLRNSNELVYEREKSFEGLIYKGHLRVDFYIPSLNTVIEYDGEHHFIPVNYGDQVAALNHLYETQRRDNIKNEFFRKNNINSIRIPFWDINNIEKILKKKLPK